MKAGWQDVPLALRDLAVGNMHQNIKTFLLHDILQIGQKKFLLLKLKIQFLGLTLFVI